jgi:putative hydroxymethylpyrimidine transport system substrate-binding protein
MKAIRWAMLGLVVVLIAGCGGGGDQETAKGDGQGGETTEASRGDSQQPPPDKRKLKPLQLVLDGYADAEHVGILMADQRGYFDDAGLDVAVLSPVVTGNVAGYVAESLDEVGLMSQPELVLAREKGMPLVAIGSLVPQPSLAMIWLRKSKIDGLADLKGKTIAINGFLPGEEALLEAVLAKAGLTRDDVKVKTLGYLLVPALVKGRVDAIFGVSGNVEGAELEARGLKPVITPVQSLGIPPFEELVVVTRRDRLARHPKWIHSFMSAVERGTAAARADPNAAAEAIAATREENGYGEPGPPLLREAKVEATLPLLSSTGRMISERATRFVDWMRSQGLIQRDLPPAALLTNRFVER